MPSTNGMKMKLDQAYNFTAVPQNHTINSAAEVGELCVS